MHHPKLFAALILSLFPAGEVYAIANSAVWIDPLGLSILSYLVFSILIYGTLSLREGVRELQALRIAYGHNVPGARRG